MTNQSNNKQAAQKYWRHRIRRLFPCANWLFNYKLKDLRYDIVAGFTVGLTLVPQCMAYAQIANVRPEFGLYSSFLAQFFYVLMGTSKDASVGPSSIVSMILAGVNAQNPLHNIGDNTYCCILSFFSGLMLIIIGVLRLGFIVNLFSIPVVSGFTSASGFSIFASQLKNLFGLKKSPNESPGVFLKQIANFLQHTDEIKVVDVAFGVSTILFLVFTQYFPVVLQAFLEKRNRKTAGSHFLSAKQTLFMDYLRFFTAGRNVIVFVFTTLAAYLLCSSDPSFESQITLVGYIKSGLPMPEFPKMEIYAPVSSAITSALSANTTALLANATSVTASAVTPVLLKSTSQIFNDIAISIVIVPLMMMMEMAAITKSLGRKNGYRVDATNELLAIGLGNVAQSFFQAMPATTAVTRCALNDQCRVKTQLGSAISATLVIVALSALTETFYYIPKAALAGIIMTAAHNLIDFGIIRTMAREYWPDLIILLLTFTLCLFFDMAYGILICLLVNMLTFLRPVVRMQMSITREIHSIADEDGKTINKMTVVKLSNGMKYPSADKFLDRMARIMQRGDKHIVLDCQFFTGIDYTGLQALRGILLIAYKQNKHIIFANLSDAILKEVEKIGLDHWLYADSVDDAVEQYNKEETVSPAIQEQQHETETTLAVAGDSQERASHGKQQSSGTSTSAATVHRVVSITRKPSHLQRRAENGDGLGSVVSYSRQSSRKTSTSRDADIANLSHLEEGGHGDSNAQTPDSIIRNLSRQAAFFYQDIPLTVGSSALDVGASSGDNNGVFSDSDDDDDVICDESVYESGLEMTTDQTAVVGPVRTTAALTHEDEHQQQAPLSSSQQQQRGYLRSHSSVAAGTGRGAVVGERRFSRISEKRECEDDSVEDKNAVQDTKTATSKRSAGYNSAKHRSGNNN